MEPRTCEQHRKTMRPRVLFLAGVVLLHISKFSDGFRVFSTVSFNRRRYDAFPRRMTRMSAKREPQATTSSVTRSTAIRLRFSGSELLQGVPAADPGTQIFEHEVLAGLGISVASTLLGPGASGALESDEFEEVFDDVAIGLELEDVKYKGSSRVLVKRVVPGSAAARRSRIKADFVLVSANGADLERQSAVAAKKIIKNSPRPLTLVFRDTSIFQQLLKPEKEPSEAPASVESASTAADVPVADGGFEPISTRVSPEGAGRQEQVLKVLSRKKSEGCEFCGQGARKGDLLEIEYSAKLENGTVFDGSDIQVNGREVVGRAGDKTLYFVLGKQPKGQFPPGWDLLLTGMCVGESRVISVPPLLGYGAQGMPRRGVPPNATLLYDVKLIGVNGVNMCVA